MKTRTTNDHIDELLRQKNKALGDHFSADAIAIRSPIRLGLDNIIRRQIEILHDPPTNRPECLVVVIETTGGSIEVVERIYAVFRKHYKCVKFVVPNFAYSAGTVLVLSGDDIYMDYYSILGPIDPQYENEDDKFVPGLGYLQKFNELLATINNSKAGAPEPKAELAYLIKKFDPATLFLLEQAKSHSESLLEEWLPKHKFKDWTQTETEKKLVDDDFKKARAHKIAEVLGNPSRWHSHGRGIGLKELTSDEIKLKIIDFGIDPKLNPLVRGYYEMLVDFCNKTEPRSFIHTQKELRRIG